ncbi:MAG: c-type cytochrome domain-containing protein [Planctomycetota bacterium]
MLRSVSLMLCFTLFLSTGDSAVAAVDFTTQVQPIFVEHCANCHGESKGLGRLRLHTVDDIREKWESDEHLIVKGKPDKSELFERLVLPADHKKFMPKKGEPLPKEKLNLIRAWIEEGAVFEVAAAGGSDAEAAESHSVDHDHETSVDAPQEIPLPEVDPAPDATVEQLKAAGAQVMPLFSGSNLLTVSYALRGEPATDTDLVPLAAAAPQIYSLNLAKAQISDEGLAAISQLENLTKLHLEKSSVADSGLKHLSGLHSLQYLNLYGTQVSDAGLKQLGGLKNLRKLYLWQTGASYDLAEQMEKARPGLSVDLGFDHPVVMRKRLDKQFKQAEVAKKEAEQEFKNVKAKYDRAKKQRETADKRLNEIKQQLDKLDGKAAPAEKSDAEPAKA